MIFIDADQTMFQEHVTFNMVYPIVDRGEDPVAMIDPEKVHIAPGLFRLLQGIEKIAGDILLPLQNLDLHGNDLLIDCTKQIFKNRPFPTKQQFISILDEMEPLRRYYDKLRTLARSLPDF